MIKITTTFRIIPFLVLMLTGSYTYSQGTDQKWAGTYHASARNKDNLLTSFTLNIAANGIAALKYISDGEPAVIYKT